jgi:hypothetical protein
MRATWKTAAGVIAAIPVLAVLCAIPARALAGPGPQDGYTGPWHTGITSTTFWVGEVYSTGPDGSQVISTYDSHWALHYGGSMSSCDGEAGVQEEAGYCATQARVASNNYYPLPYKLADGTPEPAMVPQQNPFYLDLPYDDVNNANAFAARCRTVPWASQYLAADCGDGNFSYMKNQWVRLTGPNGNTCYGQVEDAGPYRYNDTAYVFGSVNRQPANTQANHAGLDVSPALNGCLGFKALNGDTDKVSWQFTGASSVPAGPWTQLITTQPVDES